MTQPRKEQINILRTYWTTFTYTASGGVTSTTLPGTFSSSSITQTSGGSITASPPVRGILTTGIGGFVRLRRTSNALPLDDSGNQIFGRLTFSAGHFTLSYKKKVAGSEVAATIPAGSYSVDMIFQEVMNFSEVPVNADIIYGSNQELLPSSNTVSGDLVVTGNTTLGDSTSDTITLNARFNTDLIPTPDNTRSLGSSALRFANLNSTQVTARADNTDTIKSALTASGLSITGTAFGIDGNNAISVGASTATAVNLGRSAITTSINGTMLATGASILNNGVTVNGASSVFNGDVNVTGTLTAANLLFADLTVSNDLTVGNNTVLGNNSSSDTVNFNSRMISSMIPQVPDLYDVGLSNLRWREMHASRFFAHADNVSSIYSYLKPDILFSTTDFDIDGYGFLLIGASYAEHVQLGNIAATTTIDGYNITNSINQLFSVSDGTDRLVVDAGHNKIRYGLSNVLFDSTVTSPSLIHSNRSGTGSHNGQTLLIKAQDGQTQTGNNFNTIGGDLILKSGDRGTGTDGYGGLLDGYGAAGNLRMMTGKFFLPIDTSGIEFNLGLSLVANAFVGKLGVFLQPFVNDSLLVLPSTTGSFFGYDVSAKQLTIGGNKILFDGYSLGTTITQDNFSVSTDVSPHNGESMTIAAQDGQATNTGSTRGGDLFLKAGTGRGLAPRTGNVVLGSATTGSSGSNVIIFGTALVAPTVGITGAAQLYIDPADGHVKIMKASGSIIDLG